MFDYQVVSEKNSLSRQGTEFTNECIRVNKVYDWVLLNTDEIKNIAIPAASLTVLQPLIDAGNVLRVVGKLTPADVTTKIVSIVRKTVIINEKEIEIGCAQILITANLTVEVYNNTTGSTIPVVTFPVTFQMLERVGLCFPQPFTSNNITTNVLSANAVALSDVPIDGNFIFEISICQDVYVETEVKLEVQGKFCEPRDNTLDCGTGSLSLACNKPTFPPQCPDIFPSS
ncbi:hypothetical protein TcarDRAFT_1999 [Thermosinus carboxydivorans Nor1]|uniref:SipL SPOCS domain-containing protein n=1 Tax=Thermosinus carboxydivorans Nor1 TaxID=401526 RepID=A1HMN8_9FIRM|nr:hypothetical protein [Thermosinus carboxydivorans]EAX48527.1 hypothetical protein TcarDRAFT_1999 [Thermosinus carboxydivorans Nor1]